LHGRTRRMTAACSVKGGGGNRGGDE